jgi:hypothetical protein
MRCAGCPFGVLVVSKLVGPPIQSARYSQTSLREARQFESGGLVPSLISMLRTIRSLDRGVSLSTHGEDGPDD